MRRIQYRLVALEDLAGIFSYIRNDNRLAAEGVLRRIRRSISRLELFPFSGRDGVVPNTY
ncbi:MAG: type II toxin-antitoxin system RelE/ParE family toxin [Rhodospirillaceae bacterium]|nr:type II toxin-antitoxin system RelE/ParE family toxin [Rhodospirillaceae bacterium]MBT4688876.1 type II toxin-antitoxin system RelE/ParE family toxin [Rhodospirillaceae bacterium]MBT5524709.1 type II toxin-antitoxin system RelE/ParE family toxin [Rhodospirillaceae bacterium]MBT5878400.1 type II toxin-antitoxin system RelE/ParE family toxin [Rhodospirillaceae bacterium]MBT6591511.1 type II toxin-antitoxin system RelE/ParE family toxin [Rhodospirillaceae bacterium]